MVANGITVDSIWICISHPEIFLYDGFKNFRSVKNEQSYFNLFLIQIIRIVYV